MINTNSVEAGAVKLITACTLNKNLLSDDRYKHFLLESLSFMVTQERIWLFGYLLLDGEFHAMCQQRPLWEGKNVRQPILRHVSGLIKYDMRARNPQELELYRSKLKDRIYQFWAKEKIRVEVKNYETAIKMLETMHTTPTNAGLCEKQDAYRYSSAWFYGSGEPPEGVPVPRLTNVEDAFPKGYIPPEEKEVKLRRIVINGPTWFRPRRPWEEGPK